MTTEWLEIDREFTPSLAVDGDGRTICGLCVPYDTPTRVSDGGEPYLESWKRGAFRGAVRDAPRVRLVYQHDDQLILNRLGRAVTFTETDAGLEGVFRAMGGHSGDQALEMIRDGSCRGLSIHAAIPPTGSRQRPDGVLERTSARLVHVALVDQPAYSDAHVTAVRSASAPARPALAEIRALQAELRVRFGPT